MSVLLFLCASVGEHSVQSLCQYAQFRSHGSSVYSWNRNSERCRKNEAIAANAAQPATVSELPEGEHLNSTEELIAAGRVKALD